MLRNNVAAAARFSQYRLMTNYFVGKKSIESEKYYISEDLTNIKQIKGGQHDPKQCGRRRPLFSISPNDHLLCWKKVDRIRKVLYIGGFDQYKKNKRGSTCSETVWPPPPAFLFCSK